MRLPTRPIFKLDDYPGLPDWGRRFFDTLNRGFQSLYDVVSAVPEVGELVDGTFTSAASGNSSAELKITTAERPKHVRVTMLRRDDAAPLTAVWSCTWLLGESTIKLSFQGLPASVKCRFSVEYR